MIEGFVPIHRQIIHWEWYSCPKTKAVFFDLLLFAAYTDSTWHGEAVKRGQLITSVAKIAARNGMTPKAVRCALKRLEKSGSIECQGASHFTKITLLKYELYRLSDNKGRAEGQTKGEQGANKGRTRGEPRATYKKKILKILSKHIRVQLFSYSGMRIRRRGRCVLRRRHSTGWRSLVNYRRSRC